MKPARKLNYYELLGVTRESTSEEIKKAYHDCVKEFHPDLYQHKEEVSELEIKIRENILKQINAAYETLSDVYKSCKYDSELETGEITYGLERLAMYIQDVDSVYDLKWNDNITYGDVFKQAEFENSTYQLIQNQNGFYNMVFSECISNKGYLNAYPAKISSSFELSDYIKSVIIETTLSANIYSGTVIKIYGVRA